MKRELISKCCAAGSAFLAMSAVMLGAIMIRFAIYAPSLLNDVLHAIGG